MPSVTAIHEAGHVLAARAAGWKVLTSTEADDGGGETTFAPVGEPRAEDIKNILAAGAAAELCIYGEILSSCQQLASDILVFSRWSAFETRAQLVAKTLSTKTVLKAARSVQLTAA